MTQKLSQIFNVILRICIEKVHDLQYIFAVTSESPSNVNNAKKEDDRINKENATKTFYPGRVLCISLVPDPP